MITTNPFSVLSETVPSITMQSFVIVMGLLVVLGTLLDVIHKKNVKYFFENAKKAKKSAKKILTVGEKTGVVIKTITSDIKRIVNVDVGGLNNYSEKRYAVNLTMEFAGSEYSDVEFLLDDREEKSPVLLNRKILRMLNVAVNPNRKYVVTTKYSLD